MILVTQRRVPVFMPVRLDDGQVSLTTECTCKDEAMVLLTPDEWAAWLRDPHHPSLAPELVLMMDTGMHPACIQALHDGLDRRRAAWRAHQMPGMVLSRPEDLAIVRGVVV